MALGVPDQLYWRLDLQERAALMHEIIELRSAESRDAALRAGLIAAMIANCRPGRPRGSRTYRPTDFVGSSGSDSSLTPDDVARLTALSSGEILIRGD